MKRGAGPIANLCNKTMLQRIDVKILDIASLVGHAADQMLPKPTLPNTAFVARETSDAALFLFWQGLAQSDS